MAAGGGVAPAREQRVGQREAGAVGPGGLDGEFGVLEGEPQRERGGEVAGLHVGYTIAKYGMTLCALGFAAEFAADGIASNALWPRTLIATAAVQNLLGGEAAMARARKPELYADAAYAC